MLRKRKLIIIASLVILILAVGLFQYHKDLKLWIFGKPKVVEVFACSDYCPGPLEEYKKKVYEGVKDPEYCKKIGGEPYKYYGWGEYQICLAK